METFDQLGLIDQLKAAVASEGYSTPTPIQAQAIPPFLEGRDILGIAQTGTGKTAAFVLPLLQHLWSQKQSPIRGHPRSVILAPTRELAAQIGESIRNYGKNLHITHAVIFGGVGQHPQVDALRRGLDIVVATPGRLLDLMQQGHCKLDKVEFLVLDEADRMLDMGFIHDVKKIISKIPQRRQTLFFSATMPSEVSKLSSTILTDPVRIEITPQATTVERIEQCVLFVEKNNKFDLLLSLLQQKHLEKVLVFTRTKHGANKLARQLNKANVKADAIHGNKSQTARILALRNFKNSFVRVLVATDIAARGIDIDDISHVINFDIPNEAESYVHRIGRTARAGAEGTAYSLCASDERYMWRAIERITRQKIPAMEHEFKSNKPMSEDDEEKPRSRSYAPRRRTGARHGPSRSNSRPGKPRFHARR